MPHLGQIPHLLRRFRLFAPILAGATLRERIIACIGAAAGIGLAIPISDWLTGNSLYLPTIIAPLAASAVILFTVPASPLAQPWSIIGGNTISALVGVAVGILVDDPMLATAVSVSLAIAAMSLARCLHPPGGAVAITVVLGGPSVAASGWLFAFVPVALNSVILVALGVAFHQLSRRTYPTVRASAEKNAHGTIDLPPAIRAGFNDEDVDTALAALDETFDIDHHDLKRLLRQVQLQALVRSRGELTCQDIMSRDVVKVRLGERTETARTLLLRHNVRTLPVVDRDDRLVGTIGLRELAFAGRLDDLMSPAATAPGAAPAMSLVPVLTDGRTQAVIITDAGRRILGLITQTDLLSTLARAGPEIERQAA